MVKNCITCKWDRFNSEGLRMIQCNQGHVRVFKKAVEDCHAWKEKEKCWCAYSQDIRNNWNVSIKGKEGDPNPVWDIDWCPVCGKERKEWEK